MVIKWNSPRSVNTSLRHIQIVNTFTNGIALWFSTGLVRLYSEVALPNCALCWWGLFSSHPSDPSHVDNHGNPHPSSRQHKASSDQALRCTPAMQWHQCGEGNHSPQYIFRSSGQQHLNLLCWISSNVNMHVTVEVSFSLTSFCYNLNDL